MASYIDTSHAGHHPDQVLMAQVFPHERGHDSQSANLDLDVPVLNLVLHRRDQDLSSIRRTRLGGYGSVQATCTTPGHREPGLREKVGNGPAECVAIR